MLKQIDWHYTDMNAITYFLARSSNNDPLNSKMCLENYMMGRAKTAFLKASY